MFSLRSEILYFDSVSSLTQGCASVCKKQHRSLSVDERGEVLMASAEQAELAATIALTLGTSSRIPLSQRVTAASSQQVMGPTPEKLP